MRVTCTSCSDVKRVKDLSGQCVREREERGCWLAPTLCARRRTRAHAPSCLKINAKINESRLSFSLSEAFALIYFRSFILFVHFARIYLYRRKSVENSECKSRWSINRRFWDYIAYWLLQRIEWISRFIERWNFQNRSDVFVRDVSIDQKPTISNRKRRIQFVRYSINTANIITIGGSFLITTGRNRHLPFHSWNDTLKIICTYTKCPRSIRRHQFVSLKYYCQWPMQCTRGNAFGRLAAMSKK